MLILILKFSTVVCGCADKTFVQKKIFSQTTFIVFPNIRLGVATSKDEKYFQNYYLEFHFGVQMELPFIQNVNFEGNNFFFFCILFSVIIICK